MAIKVDGKFAHLERYNVYVFTSRCFNIVQFDDLYISHVKFLSKLFKCVITLDVFIIPQIYAL